MIYLELFLAYLKIGFFGFGGGYSMLSLLYHEVVVSHAWISSAQLGDIIAISQMTPGPIAINSATYVGYTIGGFWGSVVATTAVCLPSLTIMVLATRFFLKLRHSKYMECLMTAMRPSVMGMILAASIMLIFPDDEQSASMIDPWSWVLFGAAFVASLRKVSPIKLIVLSAVAGIAIYYAPAALGVQSSDETKVEATPHNIWRGFDIAQPTVIGSEEFEQAWAEYLYAMRSLPAERAAAQISTSVGRAQSNAEAQLALFDLCEKYLYNANSPMRNDELFIPVLECIIAAPNIDSLYKMRPQALLARATMNRIGEVAADLKTDSRAMLHSVEAPYTLLYFYDNDCNDCKRVGAIIEESSLLNDLQSVGEVAVVKVFATDNAEAERLYDLKAIPMLYLLDEEKRVLLKDAQIEQIIEIFGSIENNKTL